MSDESNRMETHVRLLGILNLVWGGLVALVALVAIPLITGINFGTPPQHMASVMGLVLLLFLGLAALGLVTGWGLLNRKPWARVLTFVVAVPSLPSFPLGTAFGVYAIWVMLQPETEELLAEEPASAAGRAA